MTLGFFTTFEAQSTTYIGVLSGAAYVFLRVVIFLKFC